MNIGNDSILSVPYFTGLVMIRREDRRHLRGQHLSVPYFTGLVMIQLLMKNELCAAIAFSPLFYGISDDTLTGIMATLSPTALSVPYFTGLVMIRHLIQNTQRN